MQVSLSINTSPAASFQSAYRVKKVVLNGKSYGKKDKETMFRVTSELFTGMYKKTLSEEMNKIVSRIFPDFLTFPLVAVARTPGAIYEQKIYVLTGYDAQKYRAVFETSDSKEDKRDIGAWTLNQIVNKRKNKNR